MTPVEALLRAAALTHTSSLVAQPKGPAHVRRDQDRPMCGTYARHLSRANVTELRLCRSCVRVLDASYDHPGSTAAADLDCRRRMCLRDIHQIVESATDFDQLTGIDTTLRALGYVPRAPLPSKSWTGAEVDDLWAVLRRRRSQLSTADTFTERPLLERGQGGAYYAALKNAGLDSTAVAARYA